MKFICLLHQHKKVVSISKEVCTLGSKINVVIHLFHCLDYMANCLNTCIISSQIGADGSQKIVFEFLLLFSPPPPWSIVQCKKVS